MKPNIEYDLAIMLSVCCFNIKQLSSLVLSINFMEKIIISLGVNETDLVIFLYELSNVLCVLLAGVERVNE